MCDQNEEIIDSPEPAVEQRNITVKFQLSENETVAQVYSNQTTAEHIKRDIGEKFQIDSKYLYLCQNHEYVQEEMQLYELCQNDFGILEFELGLNMAAIEYNKNAKHRADKLSLDVAVYYSNFKLPEFIPVMIATNDCGERAARRLIVKIINQPIVKPFIGGYLNNKTNVEYHDAFTQTGPCIEQVKWSGIVTRDTQTVQITHSSDDTNYDRCTQVFGASTKLINVPSATDYTIKPKSYETYEKMVIRVNKIGKIKLIQRNFRRYLLQKFIKESAAEWRRLVEEEKRREKIKEQILIDHFKNKCSVKSFPKTREDFNLLYAQVQSWKDSETKRINEMYSGGPRIAELNGMIDKEVQMLNGIERQRSLLKTKMQAKRTEKLLNDLGAPIKWIGYRNIICEMDLLRTQKIRSLTNLYRDMKKKMEKNDRMIFLDRATDILQNEKSKNIEELLPLLNREKELLTRNLGDSNLETLRQRQLVMLVDFIKEHKSTQRKEVIERKICKECKCVKPIKEFMVHTRQDEVDVCKNCSFLKFPKVDSTIYRGILRAIRRDERQRNSLSSFAFIVQEEDIKQLVENIWHGHSVLSQNNNRKELRLPRWDISRDWSPWNCILLTDFEAKNHVKLTSLESIYSDTLFRSVQTKHMLSRLLFKKLEELDFDFVQSGEWWQAGLDSKTL